jgi:hypothetical protein
MTIADHARAAASHCEGKKHAYRQTQDGVVIAFLLHPSEIPATLALDPLGTRYLIALVPVGDDEQPRDPAHPSRGASAPVSGPPQEAIPVAPAPPPAEVPATRSAQGRERYRNASKMEQALVRAVRLAKDVNFWIWAGNRDIGVCNEETAARFIQNIIGGSRSLIATDPDVFQRYIELVETPWKQYAGLMPEIRT